MTCQRMLRAGSVSELQSVGGYVRSINLWPGKQIQSHNYRTPEPFRNRVVVLIGSSMSAAGLSIEIAEIVTVDDNRMGPLYKHVFPPIFGSRAILCSSTMEARSICASITSPEHMMDDVKAFYSILEASGIPKHYTHKMLDSGKWQVHPGPVVPFSSKPRREDYAFNRGYWIWVLFHQRNLKESGASTIEGSEKISPSQSGLPRVHLFDSQLEKISDPLSIANAAVACDSEDYGLLSFDLHSDGEGLTYLNASIKDNEVDHAFAVLDFLLNVMPSFPAFK
ncbi:hypothetical protein D5086_006848 [Populus alba]|uniref:Uncharacterized protein n=1 Tax=Populus alba TaxID=43335 RepID=A0ACC4CM54_POPAL